MVGPCELESGLYTGRYFLVLRMVSNKLWLFCQGGTGGIFFWLEVPVELHLNLGGRMKMEKLASKKAKWHLIHTAYLR